MGCSPRGKLNKQDGLIIGGSAIVTTLGSALSVLTSYGASLFGHEMPAEVVGAFTVIYTAAIQAVYHYLKDGKRQD